MRKSALVLVLLLLGCTQPAPGQTPETVVEGPVVCNEPRPGDGIEPEVACMQYYLPHALRTGCVMPPCPFGGPYHQPVVSQQHVLDCMALLDQTAGCGEFRLAVETCRLCE